MRAYGLRRWSAVGAWLFAACAPAEGDDDQANRATAVVGEPARRVINVETDVLRPQSFVDYIRITGEADAYLDVVLSSEESGIVEAFHVSKGRWVESGALIASLETDVLDAQAAEARASAALAGERFERQRRLWEDEGIGSEIAFLEARYQADIARARLATLEARLSRMSIRAPFAGIFDEQYLEIGEMAGPGSQVARLVSVDRIKVTGGVPERYAAFVTRGDQAQITFDILPDRVFDGRISYVGSAVDDRNRTFPVEVVIANPDGIVKPQMVANVQLERASLDDVLVVDQQVIRRSEVGYHVFVVGREGDDATAERRDVELGPSSGSRTVIVHGLEPGDEVITVGAALVDAGSYIQVVADDREAGS